MPFASIFFVTVITFSLLHAGDYTRPGTPGIGYGREDQCPDCRCNGGGLLEAWDPRAVGHYGDRTEPAINVRRCAGYNFGKTEGVCVPGQVFNIYEYGAPAIDSPRCEPGIIDLEPDFDPGFAKSDREVANFMYFDGTDPQIVTGAKNLTYKRSLCFAEVGPVGETRQWGPNTFIANMRLGGPEIPPHPHLCLYELRRYVNLRYGDPRVPDYP